MHALVLININVHTTFEMPSFIRSNDMIGAPKLKVSHVITPLSDVVCHP